jgi:hypothetical protein
MRTILPVLEGQDSEVGHGRDRPSVTGALARGETDAGSGRFDAGATDAADAGLSHRLVRLEPVDAVMSAGHSLAGAEELRPAELPLSRRDIREIPLAQPAPLYAWSLAWREADQHPSMPALLRACADQGRANRWLEYNPERDWLPGGSRNPPQTFVNAEVIIMVSRTYQHAL